MSPEKEAKLSAIIIREYRKASGITAPTRVVFTPDNEGFEVIVEGVGTYVFELYDDEDDVFYLQAPKGYSDVQFGIPEDWIAACEME
jgi:hypothetical protein